MDSRTGDLDDSGPAGGDDGSDGWGMRPKTAGSGYLALAGVVISWPSFGYSESEVNG